MFLKFLCSCFCAFTGFQMDEFYAYKHKVNGLVVLARDKKPHTAMPDHDYKGKKFVLRQRV